MNDSLARLSDTDLQSLIAALRSGRLAAPYSGLQLSRIVPAPLSASVRESLGGLEARGFSPEQIATAFELVAQDRRNPRMAGPLLELVTSGPEAPGITNRDTAVVVRELFAHAQRSVLVVGYAIFQGQQVFEALADRMKEVPELDVQFYLNISRPDGDTTASEIIVARFQQRFKDRQWPVGRRLPTVFYDPRSVSDDLPVRSSLHAKCIVVDGEHVFVSSANFTEAAQERNIEVGVNIRSSWLAEQISRHFSLLHQCKLLRRAF
jgi:phosphatidylserine/phosphatidylglycerophosphate/cardiolipin synthase-like enzyme